MDLRLALSLTEASGESSWRDTFDGAALGAHWIVLRGTPTVASGYVVAATMDLDGYELVTTGNVETGNPPDNWSYVTGATVTSVADERTGGTGVQSMNAVRTADTEVARQSVGGLGVGMSYTFAAWLKNVSATDVYGQAFSLSTDAVAGGWTEKTLSAVSADITTSVRLRLTGSAGQAGRFDDVSLQRLAHMAVASAWPNVRLTAIVKTPAADVYPFHLTFRGEDGLNYSMVRLASGTAGNDTHIIERVAGVETTRASDDLDFAADTEYELRVDVKGTDVAVYVDDVATVTYAAAIGAANMYVGFEFLEAGGWKLLDFQVVQL